MRCFVTCGALHQGARAAMDLTHPSKRFPRWAANGSAAWLELKNPSASAGGLARRPAFEDQGRMSPCLADLDGSRWRSAVIFKLPIRAARQRGSPEATARKHGQERQDRSGTRERFFPEGFGVPASSRCTTLAADCWSWVIVEFSISARRIIACTHLLQFRVLLVMASTYK